MGKVVEVSKAHMFSTGELSVYIVPLILLP